MKIGVPKESFNSETRVSISPNVAKKFISLGYEVIMENDAGKGSNFTDQDYSDVGVKLDKRSEVYKSDILAKINPPTIEEVSLMKEGSVLISLLFAHSNIDLVMHMSEQKISAFSLDAIPRTSLAQSMDVLSSQANLAGYSAVIQGASKMNKIFPMLMTSAGTIKPATVVIFGAGVAGLQAIATAKRLGANVWVSDIRPETKEQVKSLGGKFIEVGGDSTIKTEGGYVKDVSDDFLKKQQELVSEKVASADLVITTALIPGKKAPLLIPDSMLEKMNPGAVIVDMAVSQGGNCESSVLNEIIIKNGVKIIGEGNLPATLAMNASELFAKNIQNFLVHLSEDCNFKWNLEDEITSGSIIMKSGEILNNSLKELIPSKEIA
jgi:NAD(P) transhydrogenase subunit alpha